MLNIIAVAWCRVLCLICSVALACNHCTNTLSSLRSLYRPHLVSLPSSFLLVHNSSLWATKHLQSFGLPETNHMSWKFSMPKQQLESDRLDRFYCFMRISLKHNGVMESIRFSSESFLQTNNNSNQTINEDNSDSKNDIIKSSMKASIMWYKNYLSPIMPPRCRFLPSCSSYGLEAIEKFGPWKGGILTAWRIFRCNPFGGTGYDPPVWPPPNYFAGSTTGRWK